MIHYKDVRSETRRALKQASRPEQVRDIIAHLQDDGLYLDGEMALWKDVARYAGAFDANLLSSVCAAIESPPLLLKNPAATEEHLRFAVASLVGELEFLAGERNAHHRTPGWVSEMTPFIQAGALTFQDANGQRIYTLAREWVQNRKATYHVSSASLEALIQMPDASAEALQMAFDEGSRGIEDKLLLHPAAPASVFVARLSAIEWEQREMERLAGIPRARAVPEVRSALYMYGRFKSADVLLALVPDHPPETFAELIRDVCRLEPHKAAAALRDASAEQRAALRPDDLIPLLESQDSDVRLQAIAAAGSAPPASKMSYDVQVSMEGGPPGEALLALDSVSGAARRTGARAKR